VWGKRTLDMRKTLFLPPCMQNDMFDLLFELRKSPGRFTHMAPGEWYKSWQLVWSEVDAKCSNNSPPYNPCEEFIHE